MFPCALSALDRLGCRGPCCSQVLTVKQLLLLLLPGLLGYKSINTWLVVTGFFHCLCYCCELHKCAILGRIHEHQAGDVLWDAPSAICRCISAAFGSPSLPYMPCKNSFQADVYVLPLGWLGFWEDRIWSNSAAGADNANPQKISKVNYLHGVTGITWPRKSFPINQESELCGLNSTLTWEADIIDQCYFPGYSIHKDFMFLVFRNVLSVRLAASSDTLYSHTAPVSAGCRAQVNCS